MEEREQNGQKKKAQTGTNQEKKTSNKQKKLTDKTKKKSVFCIGGERNGRTDGRPFYREQKKEQVSALLLDLNARAQASTCHQKKQSTQQSVIT